MTVLGKASSVTAAVTARAVSTTTRCCPPSTFTSSSSPGISQKSPFSSESDTDFHNNSSVWAQPNQTTVIYQKMEMKCPEIMTDYAKCVINKQNEGALIQGACEKEFIAVMDCFKSVR